MNKDVLINKITDRCNCNMSIAIRIFDLVKDHFSKRIVIHRKFYCGISQREQSNHKFRLFPIEPLSNKIKNLINSNEDSAIELIKFIRKNTTIEISQLKYYRVRNGVLIRIRNSQHTQTIKNKFILNRNNSDTDDPGPSKLATCHIIKGKSK